jgi:hypothetical protein
VKLSVSLLLGRRYVRAGEEIAEADVPEHIARKYAVTEEDPKPAPSAANIKPRAVRRPVKGSGR